MNRHIKNGLIFIGGIVIGGATTVCLAFRSQTLRKGIAHAVAEKIVSIVLEEKSTEKTQGECPRYVHYNDIYKRKYRPEEENA